MRPAHSLATVVAVNPDRFEELRRNIDPEWVVQIPWCAAPGSWRCDRTCSPP